MAITPGEGHFPHLPFAKEPGIEPPRRGRAGFGPDWVRPASRGQHSASLAQQLSAAVDQVQHARSDVGIAVDRMLVLDFESTGAELAPELLNRFDARIVDERENKSEADVTSYRAVLQFPSLDDIERFRRELSAYARDGEDRTLLAPGQRRNFFDALKQVRPLSPDDRRGDRLRASGWPEADSALLDVDLWHPGTAGAAYSVFEQVAKFCRDHGGRVVDDLRTESLLLLKVQADRRLLDLLLEFDWVAHVDLPPVISAAFTNLSHDVNWPNPTVLPDATDPIACVIDSGVIAGHPLLRNWVIEERDFDSGEGTSADLNGHGTAVAGIVVYGDIAECLAQNYWQPKVRIYNAKVLRNQPNQLQPDRPAAIFPDDSQKRIESVTEQAIRYFHGRGCRVFNLSVGDQAKVYADQRQFSWAELLDQLARELDIVIVVSVGNSANPGIPTVPGTRDRFRKAVREQVLETRLISPATAALALTVGSLARSDAVPHPAMGMAAGAPAGGPSPFTRAGPGYAIRPNSKAIKPEMADFGGNFALQALTPNQKKWAEHPAIGEPSLQLAYANRAVGMFFGTSYAAPHVTHAAAVVEVALREALGSPPSANLIRATVGAACAIPEAPRGWYSKEEKRCRMIGYGRPVLSRLPWSASNRARLIATDELEVAKFHLYRIPIPDDFMTQAGPRGITISLAFDPPVRASRKMYMARTMTFLPIRAVSATEAQNMLERFESGSDRAVDQLDLPPVNRLKMSPGSNRVMYSTLQVRNAGWANSTKLPEFRDSTGDSALTVAVSCQHRFTIDPTDVKQRYALVVDFWHANANARIYEQLRTHIRPRVRQQARI